MFNISILQFDPQVKFSGYAPGHHIETVMVDDLAHFKNVQNVGIKSIFMTF